MAEAGSGRSAHVSFTQIRTARRREQAGGGGRGSGVVVRRGASVLSPGASAKALLRLRRRWQGLHGAFEVAVRAPNAELSGARDNILSAEPYALDNGKLPVTALRGEA